ncbi:ricin-type beta-trefoil lectin domain protein [Nocardia niigatensis]|uniref:ricin-type beta-trefoil lectin domain protein n=1 Tax=Nocardia niigatensis TaxID=209249 RepID=UPI0012F6DAA7
MLKGIRRSVILLLAAIAALTVASTASADSLQIRSGMNGFCLDIQGANPDPAPVVSYPCNGQANQAWYRNGAEIRSNLNDFCLDIQGANPDPAPVVTYPCNGQANQRW